METAGNLVAFAEAMGAQVIILDATGMGALVEQRVREISMGRHHVVGVNFAARSNREEFRNMRAEVWWTASEVLSRGGAGLTDDARLHADLTAQIYEVRHGKIKMLDKEMIEREIGRSPDRGDACALGLWWLAQPQSQDLLLGSLRMAETSTQTAMRIRREEAEGALAVGAGYGESDG